MVQPLQLALDGSAQTVEPAVAFYLNTPAGVNRSLSPTGISDSVTLSKEALAAFPPSNLLTFAGSNNQALSNETAGALTPSNGSQIQKLLDEGYSLTQIAVEFDLTLADIATEYGIKLFNIAA